MSSFKENIYTLVDRGNQTEAPRPLASTPPYTQQWQVAVGSSAVKGKKVAAEKKKWPAEDFAVRTLIWWT